jgi:enoyl-CoA hydratase/carnithine racemase
MSELILVTDDGPVRTVRINRPEKKNALTFAMYEALAAAVTEAQKLAALRCLLLAGSPNDFCAGNDIGNFMQAANEDGGLRTPVLNFLHAMARCELPVVAAVQGNAVGIGTTVLLHCDHVVASSKARFATPFVSLGIVPEFGSTLIGPRVMGHARAFSLLVMGRPMNAEQAQAAGLINTIAPADTVEAEAAKAARDIAALPRDSVLTARRLMRGSPDEIVARIDEESAIIRARLKSPEARAAFEAFMARKKN